jgi:hypothetical protein
VTAQNKLAFRTWDVRAAGVDPQTDGVAEALRAEILTIRGLAPGATTRGAGDLRRLPTCAVRMSHNPPDGCPVVRVVRLRGKVHLKICRLRAMLYGSWRGETSMVLDDEVR